MVDDLTQIREFLLSRPPLDPEQLASARTALAGEIQAERRKRVGQRRWYGWRLALIPALAAVVTGGVALVAAMLASDAAAPRPPIVTASQEPEPRDDQYLKIEITRKSVDPQPDGTISRDSMRDRIWLSVDGSRPELIKQEGIPFASEGTLVKTCPAEDTYAERRRWPTDREQFTDLLRQKGRRLSSQGSADDHLWRGILEALDANALEVAGASLPPRLRPAMFQVAAGVPDVKLVKNVANAAGRRGVAVTRVVSEEKGEYFRDELIFDEKTHAYLGSRSVAMDNRGKAETGSVSSSAVDSVTVVDELPSWAARLKMKTPRCTTD